MNRSDTTEDSRGLTPYIGVGQKVLYAINFNLGPHVEIMDAELFAIYKALQHIKTKDFRDRDIYIFVDS
jgi:hypothetical protein